MFRKIELHNCFAVLGVDDSKLAMCLCVKMRKEDKFGGKNEGKTFTKAGTLKCKTVPKFSILESLWYSAINSGLHSILC